MYRKRLTAALVCTTTLAVAFAVTSIRPAAGTATASPPSR